MANGKLLRRLIRSGAEGDVEAFRGTAKAVIAEERQKQHHLLANDLETILYGHPRAPASPAVRKLTGDIPQDRERGLPLLAVREPVRGLEDIVLSPANARSSTSFCASTTGRRSSSPTVFAPATGSSCAVRRAAARP